MNVPGIKQTLRNEIRKRILAMDHEARTQEETALVERLLDLPGFQDAQVTLLYVSVFPEEFDTRPMLQLALDLNKRLICPRVVRSERRLALHEIRDITRDFTPGAMNIPEPKHDGPEVNGVEIDWVLVPGLGFDDRCYRIGRGGGYYDRLLSTLRPEVARWSLCLTSQWVAALPVEPHDQRLDGVADVHRFVTRR